MEVFDTIRCDVEDGIATLTLNRPASLNALSRHMADELVSALTALAADDNVRVLVLRGAGDAFCAGGDVRDMANHGPRSASLAWAGMACFRRLTLALHEFPRPVIAAADGVAFGAGMSLLLLSDLVLLSDRARLCLVFQRIGLVPDCAALWTLPRLVGLQRAKALAYSAREIDAREALALGLALEVLLPDRLDARARQLAQAIARGSPTSLALTKRAIDASLQIDIDTLLTVEAASQAVALQSSEHIEAVRRFAAKESSTWSWPHASEAE